MNVKRFVEAVKCAVKDDSDNWSFYYYFGFFKAEKQFNPRRLKVFMTTRGPALGFEWAELRRCVTQMKGELPRVRVGSLVVFSKAKVDKP